ncbi:MAG: hypothetical protein AABY95_09255 [Pseudomonadota bacterium]
MVLGMMRDMKDNALALSMKKWLNEKFSDLGEVLDCSLDSKACTLEMKLKMPGETGPIMLKLDRYEIEKENGDRYIVLHQFSSSREWVGRLLSRLFNGKRYKLPAAVSALL